MRVRHFRSPVRLGITLAPTGAGVEPGERPGVSGSPAGVCPEGVRISAAGNVVGLTSGHIRQCFPGEARCFCDRDDDCYAENGYVACTPPTADAGADAAVDGAPVDVTVCPDAGEPVPAAGVNNCR